MWPLGCTTSVGEREPVSALSAAGHSLAPCLMGDPSIGSLTAYEEGILKGFHMADFFSNTKICRGVIICLLLPKGIYPSSRKNPILKPLRCCLVENAVHESLKVDSCHQPIRHLHLDQTIPKSRVTPSF